MKNLFLEPDIKPKSSKNRGPKERRRASSALNSRHKRHNNRPLGRKYKKTAAITVQFHRLKFLNQTGTSK
eukprot:UN01344